MKLVRVGKRTLNLEKLVMDEEIDGSSDAVHVQLGGLKVTMMKGKEFVLCPEEAAIFRRYVDAELLPFPEPGAPGSILGSAHSRPDEADEAGSVAPQ